MLDAMSRTSTLRRRHERRSVASHVHCKATGTSHIISDGLCQAAREVDAEASPPTTPPPEEADVPR